MVKVEKIITGPIETNTYVLTNEFEQSCIIDPSSGCKEIIECLEKTGSKPLAIILTHGHFDHIMGIPEILNKYPAVPVFVHTNDKLFLRKAEFNSSFMIGRPYTYDGPISELTEGEVKIGNFTFKSIFVPGHTPGGCAFLFEKYLICGDTLFAGSIGRSDFPGGDGELLVRGIKEKLLTLPEDIIVCPGHGGRTTIGREKRANPYFN